MLHQLPLVQGVSMGRGLGRRTDNGKSTGCAVIGLPEEVLQADDLANSLLALGTPIAETGAVLVETLGALASVRHALGMVRASVTPFEWIKSAAQGALLVLRDRPVAGKKDILVACERADIHPFSILAAMATLQGGRTDHILRTYLGRFGVTDIDPGAISTSSQHLSFHRQCTLTQLPPNLVFDGFINVYGLPEWTIGKDNILHFFNARGIERLVFEPGCGFFGNSFGGHGTQQVPHVFPSCMVQECGVTEMEGLRGDPLEFQVGYCPIRVIRNVACRSLDVTNCSELHTIGPESFPTKQLSLLGSAISKMEPGRALADNFEGTFWVGPEGSPLHCLPRLQANGHMKIRVQWRGAEVVDLSDTFPAASVDLELCAPDATKIILGRGLTDVDLSGCVRLEHVDLGPASRLEYLRVAGKPDQPCPLVRLDGTGGRLQKLMMLNCPAWDGQLPAGADPGCAG